MSYRFDGSTTRQKLDFSINYYPLTISVWVKVHGLVQYSKYIWGSKLVDGWSGNQSLLYITYWYGDNYTLTFSWPGGTPYTLQTLTVPDENWHNIVVKLYDDGTNNLRWPIYYDGFREAIGSSNDPDSHVIDLQGLCIGSNPALALGSGYDFKGEMCDFAVWDVALSDMEIKQLGTPRRGTPLQIQPDHLKAYFPMSEGADGQIVPNNWVNKSILSPINITSQTTDGVLMYNKDQLSYL